jgi:hypothetical protein
MTNDDISMGEPMQSFRDRVAVITLIIKYERLFFLGVVYGNAMYLRNVM